MTRRNIAPRATVNELYDRLCLDLVPGEPGMFLIHQKQAPTILPWCVEQFGGATDDSAAMRFRARVELEAHYGVALPDPLPVPRWASELTGRVSCRFIMLLFRDANDAFHYRMRWDGTLV